MEIADGIEEILLDAQQIAHRVAALGTQISADYQGLPLLIVVVLKGAMVFAADLMRQISVPLQVDFVEASSYGEETETSGMVRVGRDVETDVSQFHVLLVEDIVDTGLTIRTIAEHLRARGALSVRICSLLDKPSRRRVEVSLDYLGFEIPDRFVVGYGLDYAQRFRQLPYVGIVRLE